MSYAGIIGQNFEIPLQQPVMPQMSPQLQQLQATQNAGVQGPQLMDGLAEVEGLTKEYYDKWSAVNSFAENMQSMGINVTKPDPMNPQSQAANRWYLKAIADLQRHGQALKNQQKTLEQYSAAKMSAHGQNITLGGLDANSNLVNAMDIQNIGETDMVKRINTDLAKSSNDPAEAQALQAQIESKKQLLQGELAQMLESGAPQQAILAKANEINQLNDATYNDTTRWQERQQNYRAKLAKEEKEPDFVRVDLVQRIKGGEFDLLRSNKNIADFKEVNTTTKKGIQIKFKNGESQFVDYNSGVSIDHQINTALNDGSEGKAVSVDDYERMLRQYPGQLATPETTDPTEAEEAFIQILSSHANDVPQPKGMDKRLPDTGNDFQSRRVAIKLLQEAAADNMTVPASISGATGPRYIGNLEVSDTGSIIIKLIDKDENVKETMAIDLRTDKGKAQLKQLIDANPGAIDYKQFAPNPLQKELRFKNTNPTGGGKVSPIIAGENRADIL